MEETIIEQDQALMKAQNLIDQLNIMGRVENQAVFE